MATDEQWRLVEWDQRAKSACIMELRGRVEALEAAQNLRQQDEDVERVAADPQPVATDEELQRCYGWAFMEAVQKGDAAPEATELAHRAVYDLGRQHGAAANSKPSPNFDQIRSLSDALIKAECALTDIAEGEALRDDGDPLKWNQQRCADTLAIIRPVMQQHKICTPEWPGSGFSPSQPPPPAPAGGLVEMLADVWSDGKPLHPAARRAAIHHIADWLELQQEVPIGVSADYFAAMLRWEAN